MAHIQLRINYEEKEAAQVVLDSLGLTMSGAIKLFLKQVVRENALPFQVSAEKEKKESVSINKAETWNGFSVKKIG